MSGLDHNKESLKDLLLKVDKMPINIEKYLTVECWSRGHHMNQIEWDAKMGINKRRT